MVTHFQLTAEHFSLYKQAEETYKCPHKILSDQCEHFHNQLLSYVPRIEDAKDRYGLVMPGHFGKFLVGFEFEAVTQLDLATLY